MTASRVMMSVVQVGGVCVAVDQRFAPVPMAVRLTRRIAKAMHVLAVFVVGVQVAAGVIGR